MHPFEIKLLDPEAVEDISKIRPLSLAYLGDTVMDLYIRQYLVTSTAFSSKEMHEIASSYVSAPAQAKLMKALLDHLTEQELSVFKRARNHKALTVPKNASPIDYRWATGLEAVLGYLFLQGKTGRILQLLHLGFTSIYGE